MFDFVSITFLCGSRFNKQKMPGPVYPSWCLVLLLEIDHCLRFLFSKLASDASILIKALVFKRHYIFFSFSEQTYRKKRINILRTFPSCGNSFSASICCSPLSPPLFTCLLDGYIKQYSRSNTSLTSESDETWRSGDNERFNRRTNNKRKIQLHSNLLPRYNEIQGKQVWAVNSSGVWIDRFIASLAGQVQRDWKHCLSRKMYLSSVWQPQPLLGLYGRRKGTFFSP